ncbi:hypothetical protein ACWE42_06415 [Sutcliffiella cohnii]
MKKIKLVDHTIKNANDQLRKPLSLLGDSRVSLTQTKTGWNGKFVTEAMRMVELQKCVPI